MSRKFQIKRGPLANLPTLAQGEIGMTTNSGSERLFMGTGAKNLEIPFLSALDAYAIDAVPASLGENRRIVMARGDQEFVHFNMDSSVPVIPTAGYYTLFMTIVSGTGVVESVLALPVDGANKVYVYSRGSGKWDELASASQYLGVAAATGE